MTFPWNIPVTLQVSVTKLTPHPTGGTDVEATFCGVALRPFRLLDRELANGADAMASPIVSEAINQVAEGLRIAD